MIEYVNGDYVFLRKNDDKLADFKAYMPIIKVLKKPAQRALELVTSYVKRSDTNFKVTDQFAAEYSIPKRRTRSVSDSGVFVFTNDAVAFSPSRVDRDALALSDAPGYVIVVADDFVCNVEHLDIKDILFSYAGIDFYSRMTASTPSSLAVLGQNEFIARYPNADPEFPVDADVVAYKAGKLVYVAGPKVIKCWTAMMPCKTMGDMSADQIRALAVQLSTTNGIDSVEFDANTVNDLYGVLRTDEDVQKLKDAIDAFKRGDTVTSTSFWRDSLNKLAPASAMSTSANLVVIANASAVPESNKSDIVAYLYEESKLREALYSYTPDSLTSLTDPDKALTTVLLQNEMSSSLERYNQEVSRFKDNAIRTSYFNLVTNLDAAWRTVSSNIGEAVIERVVDRIKEGAFDRFKQLYPDLKISIALPGSLITLKRPEALSVPQLEDAENPSMADLIGIAKYWISPRVNEYDYATHRAIFSSRYPVGALVNNHQTLYLKSGSDHTGELHDINQPGVVTVYSSYVIEGGEVYDTTAQVGLIVNGEIQFFDGSVEQIDTTYVTLQVMSSDVIDLLDTRVMNIASRIAVDQLADQIIENAKEMFSPDGVDAAGFVGLAENFVDLPFKDEIDDVYQTLFVKYSKFEGHGSALHPKALILRISPDGESFAWSIASTFTTPKIRGRRGSAKTMLEEYRNKAKDLSRPFMQFEDLDVVTKMPINAAAVAAGVGAITSSLISVAAIFVAANAWNPAGWIAAAALALGGFLSWGFSRWVMNDGTEAFVTYSSRPMPLNMSLDDAKFEQEIADSLQQDGGLPDMNLYVACLKDAAADACYKYIAYFVESIRTSQYEQRLACRVKDAFLDLLSGQKIGDYGKVSIQHFIDLLRLYIPSFTGVALTNATTMLAQLEELLASNPEKYPYYTWDQLRSLPRITGATQGLVASDSILYRMM